MRFRMPILECRNTKESGREISALYHFSLASKGATTESRYLHSERDAIGPLGTIRSQSTPEKRIAAMQSGSIVLRLLEA